MQPDDLRTLPVNRAHPAARIFYRDGDVSVVLRPTRIGDAAALSQAIAESVGELRAFMPWAHGDNSAVAQLERLKRVEADYVAGRELSMALFDETSDELLVCLGLHPRVPLNPRGLEVGYWTRSGKAKRGFATLATRMITAYAFELLECDRVQVMHDDANVASRRVIEKCGFRFEGTLRNVAARPEPALVAGGFRHSGLHRMYALVPEDRPSLAWYAPLLAALTVENLAGYPVALPIPAGT
jgi:RimJ/RimL family protein N-acetyltransferase